VSGSEDFERGLRIRREVLGDEFVDANLSGSDAFMMTFQHLVTELAWGRAWSGTALQVVIRSGLRHRVLANTNPRGHRAVSMSSAGAGVTSAAPFIVDEAAGVKCSVGCGWL
jgi:4-carboxymuconolactone decarboxylase